MKIPRSGTVARKTILRLLRMYVNTYIPLATLFWNAATTDAHNPITLQYMTYKIILLKFRLIIFFVSNR